MTPIQALMLGVCTVAAAILVGYGVLILRALWCGRRDRSEDEA